jgi:GTP-binding protein
MERPQVIAANKIDSIYEEEGVENPIERLRKEFEPQGIMVYPISAVTGQGLKELLYHVNDMLKQVDDKPVVFEKEFDVNEIRIDENLTYEITRDEDGGFRIEGPKIDKMLGYTNLDSEKGFQFFQKFLKETGILKDLEEAGIQEGDTVRMYGLEFDYYKE